MDDLVQFLRDRYDEEARDAEAAGDSWYGYEPEQQIAFVSVADARHIARHDPARVLRDIDAKRQLLELHALEYRDRPERVLGESDDPFCTECVGETFPCATLRLLALPYADYRDDWRP